MLRPGIIGIPLFYHAYREVVATKEDARVTKEDKPPEIISQRTEDGVQLPTAYPRRQQMLTFIKPSR